MILRMIFLIFPKGADGRLLRKIMAESAELTIDKAIERLNVSREKEKIILKREQETAVKELLAGRDVIAILLSGFGKSLIFSRLRRSWLLCRQISLDYSLRATSPIWASDVSLASLAQIGELARRLTRLVHNTASYAGYARVYIR